MFASLDRVGHVNPGLYNTIEVCVSKYMYLRLPPKDNLGQDSRSKSQVVASCSYNKLILAFDQRHFEA